jgi:hypothetical protein
MKPQYIDFFEEPDHGEVYISSAYNDMIDKWWEDFVPYDRPGFTFLGVDPRVGVIYAISEEAAGVFHPGPQE